MGTDEPIRIERQELDAPDVDARLAEHRSFAMHEPIQPQPAPLRFRPWFALAVAGIIGALLAWALVEPVFDDGVRFETTIREVLDESEDGILLQTDSAKVIVPSDTTVLLDGERASPSVLRAGQGIEVLLAGHGTEQDGSHFGVASFIRRLPAPPSSVNPVDIDGLGRRNDLMGFLLFPAAAALIGLTIGAADGVVSGAWSRARLCGAVGFVCGLLAGVVASVPSDLVYALGSSLAWSVASAEESGLGTRGFIVQMMGRSLAWAIVGVAAGLGQGVAMRSSRLVVNGAIGGAVGALIGGLAFDPLDYVVGLVAPTGGAEISRCAGMACVGAGAGMMIGLVELVARESWIRVLTGPLAGKEFVLYRDPTWIGSSPKNEIYLFKDAQVAPRHASIRRVGESYELEDGGSPSGTTVAGHRISRRRLRDRDRIQIGSTQLEFRMRDE
jgi:hypothetical protein